jgi:mercuric ion transport protein
MSQSGLTGAPPIRSGALSYLSLFTSLGTLLCCALPSLLVLFGLGATVA